MRQDWSPEEVVGEWTLVESDWKLIANKSGSTRLGFALTLKFFEIEARFPLFPEEIPQAAIDYVAGLVQVPATEFAEYELASSSAVTVHRQQIREAHRFRVSTRADEEQLTGWLASEVCPVELGEERLLEALLIQCRVTGIEPPGPTRLERITDAARVRAETHSCDQTTARLGQLQVDQLLDLVVEGNEGGAALLTMLKRDPGAVGLDSLLEEVDKLDRVRQLGFPVDAFENVSDKLLKGWRSRAMRMYPSDFREASESTRVTLLAVLCNSREREIVDSLVDFLIALVHKINARAERRVEKHLTSELKKDRAKENLLFQLAQAALDHPDETVRQVLYPIIGPETLQDLVAESTVNQQEFKAKVRTSLRSSYSSHYRQMLAPLLATLSFRSNNDAYRPVMDALDLLSRYAAVDGKTRF